MRRNLIGLIIFFGLLVFPVSGGTIYDEVSTSISAGIEGFIKGIVDDIVSISISSTNSTQLTQDVGVDLIYSVATFTPNPYTYGPVQQLKQISNNIYLEVLSFLLILTAISVIIHYMSAPTAAKINEKMGFNFGAGINNLLFACAAGIFILAFEYAFLWVVLSINDELSKAVILPSLNAISFDPENLILYVFLGLAYGVLMLCFYFRTLIILFWSGFGVLIGLLLIPKKTQDWALNAHYYLIQIIFFQFAIVGWYSFCIILIQGVPLDMQKIMYLIMVLVSVYFSYKFIFGINIIKAAGRVVRYAL